MVYLTLISSSDKLTPTFFNNLFESSNIYIQYRSKSCNSFPTLYIPLPLLYSRGTVGLVQSQSRHQGYLRLLPESARTCDVRCVQSVIAVIADLGGSFDTALKEGAKSAECPSRTDDLSVGVGKS